MKPLGLYIHIPFCRRKCYYCNFVSFPDREDSFDIYIDALLKEAQLYEGLLREYRVDTVFIGGGTPSLLSGAQITRLLTGLRESCHLDAREITIEVNPETLDGDKLQCYAKSGVNRLSLGLQTHDNGLLASIGRRHTYETFLNVLDIARRYFDNINVDTIFALPGQSIQSFEETLRRLITLHLPYVSCYALKIEPGTRIAETFFGADEDTDRAMYHSAVHMLEKAGYLHYETSNFALPGRECRHNLKYWTGGEYLGLGVAAHSYIDDGRKIRFGNTEELSDYLSRVNSGEKPVAQSSTLTTEDEKTEYIMLRLRLRDGIDPADYTLRFGEDFMRKYAKPLQTVKQAGLIEKRDGRIVPTLKGFDLQNTLITELIGEI